jgi:hypothetical protein
MTRTDTQLVQRHRNRDWSHSSLNNDGLWLGPAFAGTTSGKDGEPLHGPSPPFLRSGSTSTGGGQILHS